MAVRIESQSEPIAGYRLLERLGSGGFGEVWKAEAPGGIFKAIKVIFGDLRNRETDTYRFAEQELKALKRVKQVRHPYLLALDRYDIVEGRLMIVMELADCNLWDRFRVCRKQGLPGIPRDELVRYMSESAEVLDLFNDQHQLQHLDIKPQNLFLLYNHVKVADFGQVKDLQGMMASVTGGITPVYAAPETFDGFVSRFCDQYSLACVYQELLTGVRPFDGTSMQQLLMQHLQMPPNLAPSPTADRPALMKALSKKPEDRFPSVMAMVDALKSGVVQSVRVPVATAPPAEHKPSGVVRTPTLIRPGSGVVRPGSGVVRSPDATPPPSSLVETVPPPDRIAPPESHGTGPLRPVVVVGVGTAGLEVVRRFRRDLIGRYGSFAKLPALRTLYIDTDPDTVTLAANAPPDERVGPDETYLARLYRAGHYLKPRLNGRTLIEGWFDPQMLYKLPRNPVTLGHRVFGRLAFCDHFRPLTQKIQAELDLCLSPEALAATKATTGLDHRTNRPRVYVVAGLAGGTGGGMFIDLAYAIRYRLRRLGYHNPDVVGLLLVPPEGPTSDIGAPTQANTYAALTELHHYSRPETVFSANYDDRNTVVTDAGPPFSHMYLLPGPTPQPVTRLASARAIRMASLSWGDPKTEREPADAVAEFLRLSILSQVGGVLDEAQPHSDGSGTDVRTFGSARFRWPRAEVVDRAARVLSPVLVGNWVAPDPQHIRKVIPNWAADHWGRLGLDPERLAAKLSEAADYAAGGRVADVLATTSEHLTPKGWLGRLPDPEKVSHTLSGWQKLLGRPVGAGNRASTILDDTLTLTADSSAETALAELAVVFPALIEAPLFRLAGTEEAIRQVLVLLDRTRGQVEQQAAELEATATATFDLLLTHVNYQKGMRKPTVAEFADAAARYPVSQHRSLLARSVIRVYRRMREQLAARLAEMVALRQRIEACQPRFAAEADAPARTMVGDLLPQGCQTAEDAAQVFLRSLTDDDLHALDARVQAGLEHEFGGLYHACLNSTDGLEGLMRVIREETRNYLNDRLGEVDLASMFYQRYGTGAAVAEQLTRAHTAASPSLVGLGPWAQHEVVVFAGPSGLGGNPLRELAVKTLPPATVAAEVPDELVLHREYPAVPLAALPQLGPAWASAYQTAPEVSQITPHARLDITKWIDVDSVE